ncbi:fluoride efflux transporter CrcB [Paenactinomyces guangxiensis]|uniref:Fluoride-specific ion channel FluC n=1 Tax=Paenactinomyces guangxiensis TaxID=1490290 RepID=A0A7W1WSY1_9BACL|nr:fluoride efflux transporter CrcB [Paenactinomyces guangxiensis]MBA4495417.1 fluoride efflux transporter CrcB [Paenactinomyces guangxiensis]MBH8592462.1 fluoride efflux transporter CrcB [Paenactinomyces guangxiensis]
MTSELWTWIIIGLGGSFGAVTRYALTIWVQSISSRSFPFATFLINITGSFLFGICLGWNHPGPFHFAVTTGFLGGYTTFSTFGVESVELLQKKGWVTAALYILLSVSLSLAGVISGYSWSAS